MKLSNRHVSRKERLARIWDHLWRLLSYPMAFWGACRLWAWGMDLLLGPPPAGPQMAIYPSRSAFPGIHLPPIVIGLVVDAVLAFFLWVLFGSDAGSEP